MSYSEETVPPWVHSFPTEGEYTAALVEAVGGVLPEALIPFNAGSLLSEPIAVQVESLAVAFEATTGVPFGELVSLAGSAWALAQADTPAAVATAAFELLDGALQLAVTVANTAGMATDLVTAIPIIGQIIQVVAFMVVAGLEADAARKEALAACQRYADEKANAECQAMLRRAYPIGTGREGVDPSDLFRPLMYVWRDARKRVNPADDPAFKAALEVRRDLEKRGLLDPGSWEEYQFAKNAWDLWHGVTDKPKPGVFNPSDLGPDQYPAAYEPRWKMPWKLNAYPPGAPSLYLGLCGHVPTFPGPYTHVAPRDFALFWDRDEYAQFSRTIGGCEPIPEEVQRKMWTIVRALMTSVRDPRPAKEGDANAVARPSDGGRALYPVLQDLVNNERHRGRVTPALLRGIQHRALYHTLRIEFCEVHADITAYATRWSSCFLPADNPRTNLVGPFWAGLDEYDNRLKHVRAELAPQLEARRRALELGDGPRLEGGGPPGRGTPGRRTTSGDDGAGLFLLLGGAVALAAIARKRA